MATYQKQSTDSIQKIPINIPTLFFTEIGNTVLNFIWKYKNPSIVKINTRTAGSIPTPDLELWFDGAGVGFPTHGGLGSVFHLLLFLEAGENKKTKWKLLLVIKNASGPETLLSPPQLKWQRQYCEVNIYVLCIKHCHSIIKAMLWGMCLHLIHKEIKVYLLPKLP